MSIAMKVETFECAETIEESVEVSQEAADLIEELGLTGQKSFINRDANEQVEQRCPYRLMTAEETAVYRVLCPATFDIGAYDAAPIPIRVLQIAAHATQVIKGVKLKIWDKEKHVVNDPVLVGYVGQYDWRPDGIYILARWGEQLDAFATLRDMAIKMLRERLSASCKRFLATVQQDTGDELLKHRDFRFPGE